MEEEEEEESGIRRRLEVPFDVADCIGTDHVASRIGPGLLSINLPFPLFPL